MGSGGPWFDWDWQKDHTETSQRTVSGAGASSQSCCGCTGVRDLNPKNRGKQLFWLSRVHRLERPGEGSPWD